MMDLTGIYGIATAIAVIVVALTQVIKKAEVVPSRYMPIVALILGILLGIAAAPIHTATMAELIWGGGISGLMASGAFDAAKKILRDRAEQQDFEDDTENKKGDDPDGK